MPREVSWRFSYFFVAMLSPTSVLPAPGTPVTNTIVFVWPSRACSISSSIRCEVTLYARAFCGIGFGTDPKTQGGMTARRETASTTLNGGISPSLPISER